MEAALNLTQPAVPKVGFAKVEGSYGQHVSPELKQKMREKATEFEAFYLSQMLELMKPKNEATQFNGGVGEEMFRKELHIELGRNLAKAGGFGIADKVYAELLKQQEGR